MQAEVKSITLICDRETLIKRWKNDHSCEWRTNQWLKISLASLKYFSSMKEVIETSELTVDQMIYSMVTRESHGLPKYFFKILDQEG